ncbi:MAG: DUF3795 domain-containing protein [Candidatus Bathyarchaeota archaeon]|nr:MAG: DUF3795 domain-containing protein [Candidatus Bathyarchaeota archaeon]
MSVQPVKTYPTIACCGLDCGLCPRYYTVGTSKCPGCCGQDFFNKHPSCSYITCCVKKKQLEVCAQCDEFPCTKFDSSILDGGEYDSFLTYKKAYQNLTFIRNHGVKKFVEQQNQRIKLLTIMLNNFDEGRSKSFYCLAATLLPIESIEHALDETNQKLKIDHSKGNNRKTKAKMLKAILNDLAAKAEIELKLRKKPQK